VSSADGTSAHYFSLRRGSSLAMQSASCNALRHAASLSGSGREVLRLLGNQRVQSSFALRGTVEGPFYLPSRKRPFVSGGGSIRYQPTNASATAWRSFMAAM
jgi:hypothetical protein